MGEQTFLSKEYEREVQEEEYPKYIDFNPKEMQGPVARYLALIGVIGLIFTVLSFATSQPYFFPYKIMSVGVMITVGIMALVFAINTTRTVKTVMIEKDCFYVNNDRYPIDDTTKVKIAPVLPVAGKADNIYLTVKSKAGNKKYWVGVVADPDSSVAREKIKTELIRLSSSLLE